MASGFRTMTTLIATRTSSPAAFLPLRRLPSFHTNIPEPRLRARVTKSTSSSAVLANKQHAVFTRPRELVVDSRSVIELIPGRALGSPAGDQIGPETESLVQRAGVVPSISRDLNPLGASMRPMIFRLAEPKIEKPASRVASPGQLLGSSTGPILTASEGG